MGRFAHFFFASRRRHTRSKRDWSSDVCSSDLVARDDALLFGHQERYARADALREVIRRPGIGEHGSFDRTDVADVSQPGGANRVTGGRGAPPIWPALPQDVHTPAPR